jgi:hypothetical protein
MGLTLSYSLLLESASRQEAREKMETLRRLAADLPLMELGELVDLEGDACRLRDDDPDERVKFGAMTLEDYGEIHKQIDAAVPSCLQLIGFRVLAGDGCSSCSFGLASHAASPHRWAWYDFCKTQYASNPDYGGLENFLRCHLSIIKIMEGCQRLGLLNKAHDPSGYWETHDVEALVKSLRQHNIFTAAMIGSVKDLLDPLGYTAQAPILERPDFEHLEAEGRTPKAPPSPPPAADGEAQRP